MSQNSLAQIEHGNHIIFNEESFKKTTKKLVNNINSIKENGSYEFKLSEIQEALAKALGFRNANGIQSYFSKDVEILEKKSKDFLNNWDSENIQLLFVYLMSSTQDDMWKGRALLLLQAIINALCFLRDKNEIILSTQIMTEYIVLENIVTLYNRKDFPIYIKEKLRSYLRSLPGFREGEKRQSETVMEQHGYLQMQLLAPLEQLEKIELHDPIIISPKWYQANYVYTITDNIKNENSKEVVHLFKELEIKFDEDLSQVKMRKIKTSHRLYDNSIEKFYDKFPEDEWSELFPNFTNKEYSFYESSSEQLSFTNLSLIKPIVKTPYAENSWLEDNSYKLILNSLLRSKQFKTYRLSDLLIYSFRIVNQSKYNMFNECLMNLLKNYTSVVQYSEIFTKLAK